jgi:hypothetical protein
MQNRIRMHKAGNVDMLSRLLGITTTFTLVIIGCPTMDLLVLHSPTPTGSLAHYGIVR